jgi:hypothetical protein
VTIKHAVAGVLTNEQAAKVLGLSVRQVKRLKSLSDAADCGNCGEQSAIAFVFLRDCGVRPLDRVGRKLIDHAFVVIGRASASSLDDVRTWGPAAVICDPWALQSYGTMEMAVMPAREAPRRWKNKMGVRILDGRPTWFTVGSTGKLAWVPIGFNAVNRLN